MFRPFCKTCIRPAIAKLGIDFDVSSLDDRDLRRVMDTVNVLAHNAMFTDPAKLHEAVERVSRAFERKRV